MTFYDLNDPDRDIDVITLGGVTYEFGDLVKEEAAQIEKRIVLIPNGKKGAQEWLVLAKEILLLWNDVIELNWTEDELKIFILALNRKLENASDSLS